MYRGTEPRFPLTVVTELPELLIPDVPQVPLPILWSSKVWLFWFDLSFLFAAFGNTVVSLAIVSVVCCAVGVGIGFPFEKQQCIYKIKRFTGHTVYMKQISSCYVPPYVGRDSSVGIATRYGLDGPGIESRWGARFSAPVQTGPGTYPASCTVGTGSLQGGKAAGAWCWHPPSSDAVVKERVELYRYFPSGPSWPALREIHFNFNKFPRILQAAVHLTGSRGPRIQAKQNTPVYLRG